MPPRFEAKAITSRNRASDDDWLHIKITDAKFVASGDPTKLVPILAAFLELKKSDEAEGD